MEKALIRFKFPTTIGGWIALIVIVGVLVGGSVLGYYIYTRTNPAEQVRRHLMELCSIASKGKDEGTSAGILKIRRISEMFDSEVVLEFRAEVFTGRFSPQEIAANFSRYRIMMNWAKVSMSYAHIKIVSDTEANAEFTGEFTGELKSGERISEVRELICHLVKIEDEWKVQSITVREVLEQ